MRGRKGDKEKMFKRTKRVKKERRMKGGGKEDLAGGCDKKKGVAVRLMPDDSPSMCPPRSSLSKSRDRMAFLITKAKKKRS